MHSIRGRGLWIPIGLAGAAKTLLPRYTLLSADFVASVIRIRSVKCCGYVSQPGCCSECDDLDGAVDVVERWSQQSFGKKSIDRLSHDQLALKLKALAQQLASEQVKRKNRQTSLKAARKRLGHYRELFNIVSLNEVPGLSRLFSTAKKEGWSPKKTAEHCLLAVEGKYHPRNYTEFDRELATLIYELGGGAALYALNKSPIMLPSRQTIAETRRELNLRITVGNVKVSDIMENIEVLFGDGDTTDSGLVLHSLLQDEIAGDGRPCYLEDTDEIGGLCEHATNRLKTFKMGTDLSCAEEAVKAVRSGEIHVGKEFNIPSTTMGPSRSL
ncbi:hypothetical protein R3P38DRAFT_2795761 [Favolaschia claudopus]|uniref:Uncharacterized protein n=1 Tax=Favolaschia claudopus TaxID=2862362 RepID=A0AAW0A6Q5_9AGAR